MHDEGMADALRDARDQIIVMEDQLARFYAKPIVHATVIASCNQIDPNRFLANDLVVVMVGDYEGRTGRLVPTTPGASVVNKDGYVTVMFADLTKEQYNIGFGKIKPGIKLLGKDDGTNVTVSYDGTCYEVYGVWGQKFQPGQPVKVNLETKQIIEGEGILGCGDICFVKQVLGEKHVEVEHNGITRIILIGGVQTVMEPNDRVQLDRSNTVVLRHLGRQDEERFTLTEEIKVTWDDIGGCEEAKELMQEVIELPFAHPEIYAYYNKRIPKGVLLYGPPGNGKSMIGKAAANSLANRFGKKAISSGFIYVKGPELLSMWVGNTEQMIRELFHRGNKHYKRHNFPAILFIDEAEAILPMRGSGRSSDVDKTIVPMFLSEMDGLMDSHVIVILATNRPEMLDPAAIRDGRVDRRVKVPRPTMVTAAEILSLHLRGVPLCGTDVKTVAAVSVAEIFSKQWVLYKLTEKVSMSGAMGRHDHILALKDCLNGAMLASLVDIAVTAAMKRDLRRGKHRGVELDDFRHAVERIYRSQLDLNHHFDLEDFIDTHKIGRCELSVEKLKAAV